jgi:hypothetical protein
MPNAAAWQHINDPAVRPQPRWLNVAGVPRSRRPAKMPSPRPTRIGIRSRRSRPLGLPRGGRREQPAPDPRPAGGRRGERGASRGSAGCLAASGTSRAKSAQPTPLGQARGPARSRARPARDDRGGSPVPRASRRPAAEGLRGKLTDRRLRQRARRRAAQCRGRHDRHERPAAGALAASPLQKRRLAGRRPGGQQAWGPPSRAES